MQKQRITLIKKADWVIAWDSEKKSHTYLKKADVAFQGNTIQFVGQEYMGKADVTIDGRDTLVMPGLINLHSHLFGGSVDKGIFDDIGAKALYGHALYSYSPLLRVKETEVHSSVQASLCDLVRSGVTTVVDISRDYPDKLDLLAQSGMRVYIGESFRQAQWVDVKGRDVRYDWNEQAGWKGLEKAIETIQTAVKHPSGRLNGILIPAQVDTCNADLFQEAFKQAEALNVPFHTHAAQTLIEVHEMLRRYGISPIQWLEEIGVLSPRTTLGHCIFLDHHPWSPLRSQDDLDRLVSAKVSVAHCPTVFARTGMALHSFGTYYKRGVNLGIGTDSYPYNMLEELRMAIYIARIVGRSVFDTSTSMVFHAATVGGANALLREDLGRIAPECKADLVLLDLNNPLMKPVHDPLRSLIYVAADRAVKDVFVDGQQVVRDGEVLTLDLYRSREEEQWIQKRVIARVPEIDPEERSLSIISPLCFD